MIWSTAHLANSPDNEATLSFRYAQLKHGYTSITARLHPQVWAFPADAVHLSSHPREFGLLALLGLLTSFTSTLMFTAMGSFFNRISDPDMVRRSCSAPCVHFNGWPSLSRCSCLVPKLAYSLQMQPALTACWRLLQGGAYLTLLNTVANMGVILPKLAIFAAIDWLSARTCVGSSSPVSASACPANHAKVCS